MAPRGGDEPSGEGRPAGGITGTSQAPAAHGSVLPPTRAPWPVPGRALDASSICQAQCAAPREPCVGQDSFRPR